VQNPQGITVVCGNGLLLLRRLQMEGRQATDIDDFVRGYREFPGSRLGST
ncbi:MAG: methionyl-tRNA formyltransferase, partial [Chloroflexi bacterium]|nr:methionyl-tRNA formyltransferase [Chloroflexota bacterium]